MKQTLLKNLKKFIAILFLSFSLLKVANGQVYCDNSVSFKINGKYGYYNTPLTLCDNQLVLSATFSQSNCWILEGSFQFWLYKDGVNIGDQVTAAASYPVYTVNPHDGSKLWPVSVNISITINDDKAVFGSGKYQIVAYYQYMSSYDYHIYDCSPSSSHHVYTEQVTVNITDPGWHHKKLNPLDPGNITSSIATNDNFLIFYKDGDRKVSCTYPNGSSYDTKQLVYNQATLVDGFLTAKRNANVVYFKGDDKNIHAVYFDNSIGGWAEKKLASNQPGDVAGYLATNDGNNVYYKDNNGRISCVYFDNNTGWTWRGPLVPQQAVNDVAGDVITKKTGNDIFYRSSDGYLKCITYDNGWVSRGKLAANQPPNDIAPDGGIATNNNNNIYYKGANDSKIHCVYFDNSLGKWNWKVLAPNQDANVAGDVVTNDGLTVYYRTDKNRINCIYFDAGLGQWAQKDPDPNAPSNVAGDLAIRTNAYDCYYRGLGDNKMYAIYLGLCPPNLSKVASSEPVSVTSTNSSESSQAINCYPVPFSDNFTFEYNLLNAGSVEIEIYNSMGKMVKRIEDTGKAGNNAVEIDAKELESGFYSINLKANGKMIASKKISKVR